MGGAEVELKIAVVPEIWICLSFYGFLRVVLVDLPSRHSSRLSVVRYCHLRFG